MNLRHFITFSALFAATQANALPVASVSLDTVTVSPSAPYTGEDGLLTDYSNAAASPWMKKLQFVAQGGGATFRILQIGDSHTAGDFFTDTLRKRLQKTWGDGGIGWVYPANVKGQRMAAVRYSGNWQSLTSRNNTGDFPLGGILAKTGDNGSMTLTASDGQTGKQRISLFAKPLLAEQTLTVNGNTVSANGSGWQVLDTGAALPLTIQTEMPWDIGFINIENPAGGITVSAMGINGAQLTHWSKWRADRMNDLAQTGADLVILAYGTNEAFGDNIDIADTEQKWLDTVRQIRDSLPAAGILIIGAPESLKNTLGVCGTRPVRLTEVQQMQRRVARQGQTMFWSWQNAMGGICSMKNWLNHGWAAKDGVHFSAKGYQRSAEMLADNLEELVRSATIRQ